MKSFSLAVVLALVARTSEAFLVNKGPSSSAGRVAFLATSSKQQQPLFVSTELTAEAVGQSSDDDHDDVTSAEATGSSSVDIAVETTASSDDADGEAANKRIERVRHTLFVGNLPFDSDEDTVRAIFSEFGEVVMVALPRNRESGRPRGFAFVDMATEEEMKAAVDGITGRLIDGRVLRASPSLPKDEQPKKTDSDNGMGKVYVGNLSFDMTKEMLVEHFEQYGTVFEVYMPTDENNKSRGYGFVTLKKDEIDNVIGNANGSLLEGRELVVTLPLPRGERPPANNNNRRPKKPTSTKIYVGNLSFYTIQETLEEVFSEFGQVMDCYIPPDPTTGSSRGFGFVTMDPEDAKRAIAELDSCELDGRIIRVNEAQPKGGRPPRRSKYNDEDAADDE